VASEVWPNVPNGLFSGTRAMTVQGYIEANVKNGVQYESSSPVTLLGAGANIDTIFITGSKPVIIKDRIVKFNGVFLTTKVYRAPAYTGGTPRVSYNLNDITPVVSTVQIIGGATVTDVGTEFGAATYDIGSTGIGNVQISTYSATGVERILRPNTVYLQRITNEDAAAQSVAGTLTWYEGVTDLPLTGPLP
jgi:hypothetical protein